MAKKKTRVPKKVAGFKVPKSLRRSSMLKTLLNSPYGRDILAKAITAGAGAAAAVLITDREEVAQISRKGARKGARAIGIATDAVQSAAGAVMGVISDAAGQLLPGEPAEPERGRPRQAARH